MNERIKQRIAIVAVLIAWGGLILWFKLVQLSPYGIEEGAARALLLGWTLADRVINPIVVFGIPDLRALLFAPLALYWTGSLLAAKVYTLLALFGAVLLLHRWARQTLDDEVALIASGLLLIAPVALMQADAIGGGVYLLLLFGVGHWIDQRVRARGKSLSAWYFVHLIVIAAIVSIHPIGLGYALAMLWHRQRTPVDRAMQRQMLIGVTLSALFVGLLQAGWTDIQWLSNPITVIGASLLGLPGTGEGIAWFSGIIALAVLTIVIFRSRKFISGDSLASSLLLATLIGLLCADGGWALIATTLLLYVGILQLIRAQKFGMRGFLAQRGLATALLFVIAFIFMQGDKTHREILARGDFSPHDRLIETLVHTVDSEQQKAQVASQWPGRTMLALKQSVWPLPRATDDDATFLQNTQGLTHLIFDHTDPANVALARQIAGLSATLPTSAREAGGVIISVRRSETAP